jgi:hypothetical protein
MSGALSPLSRVSPGSDAAVAVASSSVHSAKPSFSQWLRRVLNRLIVLVRGARPASSPHDIPQLSTESPMIHKFSTPDAEFLVHRFEFSYQTDHTDGLPAEHGAVGFLDVEIHVDSQDKDGKNFNAARAALWKYAVNASRESQSNLRRKFKLSAEQKGGLAGGARNFDLEGWVSKYAEITATESGKAGRDYISARIIVRAKDRDGYQPNLT